MKIKGIPFRKTLTLEYKQKQVIWRVEVLSIIKSY